MALLLALTMFFSLAPLRASAAIALPQGSDHPGLTNPPAIPQDRDKSGLPKNLSLSRNSQEELPPELLTAPFLEPDTETIVALAPNTAAYFRFIPETTDLYTFYAVSDDDTFGIIEDGTEATYDDDSGEGNNFSLTMLLTAGKTYYLTACFYFAYASGSFTVTMEQSHQFTETVTTPATCTSEGLLSRVCDYCGLTETEVLPSGHDWVDGECTRCGEVFLVTGTCGENLTWELDGKGNLTISGTGPTDHYGAFDVLYNGHLMNIDESAYTAPPAPWSEWYSDIRTLTLEPGITSIGYYTFWGLTELKQVTVPEGVTEIFYGAFAYCPSLESISLPSTLGDLDLCFEYCFALSEVTFEGPVPKANTQVLYPLPDGLTVYYHSSAGNWEWILENWYLPGNTRLFDMDSSVAPEDLAFAQSSYTLEVGQFLTLVTNADTYVQTKLTQWDISAPDIVFLSPSGRVTALRPGTVEITLSSPDGVYRAVCTVTVTASQIPDSAFAALEGTGAHNLSCQDYIMWDAPKTSFLSQRDGVLERVQYVSDTGVVVARYDSAFALLSEVIIPAELPLFGGFFAGQDYNFLLYGQTNQAEDNSAEVLRVVRYTKDWQRLDHCSILGANTTVPFDAGTADFAEQNGILYLHTCHEMYTSSDGRNHQANMTFAIDQQTMTVVDQWYDVMNISYGYVSHSFGQRIRTNDRYIFRADHGDAHPRSVVLTRASIDGSLTNARSLNLLNIVGRTGDNYTGVSLGGLELSADSCLVVGNSVDQTDPATWHPQNVRNVFLAVADQELTRSDIIWLTDYSEGTAVFVSTPQLVSISDGLFLVLWEERESEYNWDQAWTCAVLVDGSGSLLTRTVKLDCRLSDCQPILTDSDHVSWFTCGNDYMRLNQLSWRQLLQDGSGVEEDLGHDYIPRVTEPTCTDQGYTTYICSSCGDSYVDDYVDPLGHEPGEWVVIYEPSCSHTGTQRQECLRCGDSWLEEIAPLPHQYSTSVTPASCTYQGYTDYSCDVCGDWYRGDYVDPLGHDLGDWELVQESTCIEYGYEVQRCSRCGFAEYRDLPLGEHDYVTTVVEPGCYEGGYTIYRCFRCSHQYTDDYTEPAGHNFSSWAAITPPTCTEPGEEVRDCFRCGLRETREIPVTEHSYTAFVTAPTCTEGGYTEYHCHCGAEYVGDYTEPLGHDFGAWQAVTAPTCTEAGLERRDCSRCDAEETQPIPATGHSYTAQVIEPTCTEAGYTLHTCSCGDRYTTDPVDPLGHVWEDIRCGRCGISMDNPFTDVKETDFFYDSVLWAMVNGITAGTSPTTFAPNNECTRAQVVTFLWRSQGCPAPESQENPFTDVDPGSYYYDAVLWAVEQNITAGTGNGLFSPNASCTRAQVVTFLWRTFGTPAPESDAVPFTDVTEEAYFCDPVLWAVEQGITAGTGNGLFSPNAPCTRAQVVTFLYRAVK